MSAVPQTELDAGSTFQPHQLQRLKAVHYLIMDLHLAGLNNKQIAEELDKSPVGIGLIIQCPLFQQELARKQSNQEKVNTEQRSLQISRAKEILEQASIRAAYKVSDQIDNPDESLAQRSAFGILDRVFPKDLKDGTQNNFNGPVVVLGADALKLLQQAQKEDVDVLGTEPIQAVLVSSSADAETAKLSSDTPPIGDSIDAAVEQVSLDGVPAQVDGL